jgi:hypothetical protein
MPSHFGVTPEPDAGVVSFKVDHQGPHLVLLGGREGVTVDIYLLAIFAQPVAQPPDETHAYRVVIEPSAMGALSGHRAACHQFAIFKDDKVEPNGEETIHPALNLKPLNGSEQIGERMGIMQDAPLGLKAGAVR